MRYIITHGHIFKNAGTTFDSALEKAFGKDFCDHRDDKAMRRGGAEYLKQFILDNPNLKAISSHHLCNPLPESEEFKCIPVYFLRNPIERIISVYNFERKQKTESLGAKMASKMSLEEYVRWRFEPDVPKVISNYQTAYLSDKPLSRKREKVNLDVFLSAIENIKSKDTLIGTVEQFDASFNYISKQLNQFFPEYSFSYKVKNVKRTRGPKEKYQEALYELKPVLADVIENNSYDIALHKLASEELLKRLDN